MRIFVPAGSSCVSRKLPSVLKAAFHPEYFATSLSVLASQRDTPDATLRKLAMASCVVPGLNAMAR